MKSIIKFKIYLYLFSPIAIFLKGNLISCETYFRKRANSDEFNLNSLAVLLTERILNICCLFHSLLWTDQNGLAWQYYWLSGQKVVRTVHCSPHVSLKINDRIKLTCLVNIGFAGVGEIWMQILILTAKSILQKYNKQTSAQIFHQNR